VGPVGCVVNIVCIIGLNIYSILPSPSCSPFVWRERYWARENRHTCVLYSLCPILYDTRPGLTSGYKRFLLPRLGGRLRSGEIFLVNRWYERVLGDGKGERDRPLAHSTWRSLVDSFFLMASLVSSLSPPYPLSSPKGREEESVSGGRNDEGTY
jgi:hypothetical protein